jgi:uncharacterized protein YdaU (DUF1376 family)
MTTARFHNVRIENTSDHSVDAILRFEGPATRYHLWLSADLAPREGTLYANDLDPASRRMARQLDATAQRWAPVLAAMFASLDLAAERQRIDAEIAAKRAAAAAAEAEARRAARVREAAPALLAALETLLLAVKTDRVPAIGHAIDKAEAVVAATKAEG